MNSDFKELLSIFNANNVRYLIGRRELTDFDGIPAYVISRHDPMTNKQASGRPQDLIDLENLKLSAQVEGGPGQESEKHK